MKRQPISAQALQLQRAMRKDDRVISLNASPTWISIRLTWDGMAELAKDTGKKPELKVIQGTLHAMMTNGRLEFWAMFKPIIKTREELIAEAGL